MKVVPKVKKEAPAPTKAKAKQRFWRQRKQCWKASQPHTQKEDLQVTHIPMTEDTVAPKAALSILRRAPPGETSSNTTPSSSSPDYWVSPGEDKTTIHLCSLWKSRPTSTRSNRLWRSCMTLMWPRSTPWSGLMGRRRRMFDWLQTMTLWMLPTKLGSSKLSPAG